VFMRVFEEHGGMLVIIKRGIDSVLFRQPRKFLVASKGLTQDDADIVNRAIVSKRNICGAGQ
jgi:hypothetical protein